MSLHVDCPHCRAENIVEDPARGCYIPCRHCGCKFYVPVPTLEAEAASSSVVRPAPSPAAESTGSNSDGRVLMRQESLLATLHEELVALRQRITICCAAIVVAILISALLPLLWR